MFFVIWDRFLDFFFIFGLFSWILTHFSDFWTVFMNSWEFFSNLKKTENIPIPLKRKNYWFGPLQNENTTKMPNFWTKTLIYKIQKSKQVRITPEVQICFSIFVASFPKSLNSEQKSNFQSLWDIWYILMFIKAPWTLENVLWQTLSKF